MAHSSQKGEIISAGDFLYKKGFVQGTNGNLSILVKKKLLITPAGRPLNILFKDELILIDQKGNKITGYQEASSEKLLHIFVYQNRPGIRACCHAHPPYATAFAVSGEQLRSDLLPEALISLGEIAHTEYARPGTNDLPRLMEKYIAKTDAFILANHGVLTIGRDMQEACHRMEAVEHLAKISYIASQMGKLKFLEKNEVARLLKIRGEMLQG